MKDNNAELKRQLIPIPGLEGIQSYILLIVRVVLGIIFYARQMGQRK